MKPPRGACLHTRFGGHLARNVIDQRAFIDYRAMLEQQANHGRLLLRGGPHECGLIAPLLVRVDVGAVTDQQLRGIDIAGPRHNHQRRLAIRIGRLDIGAGRQQCAQQVHIATDGRLRHWCCAIVVARIGFRASRQKRRNKIPLAVMDCPVQGGGAIGSVLIHVRGRMRGEQRAQRRHIIVTGRQHQRRHFFAGFDHRRGFGACHRAGK